MTDLRKAAQQALEALEFANVNHWWGSLTIEKTITALKAALEQHEQEIEQAVAALAQPEPLEPAGEEDMQVYAAIADGYYGRLKKRIGCVQPEPEPVGWLYESQKGVRFFHPSLLAFKNKRFQADWELARQHPEAHKMTPLYLHPPQRKPLTEEQIYKLFGWYAVPFVRAIEKAHGIGDEV
jgi:hypothetical protein